MQHPAVPDLAHTRARPIHWVATAAAVAGVVALSPLLAPGPATARHTAATGTGTAPGRAAPPDAEGVAFPLECGPVRAVVARKAVGDLDGDGRPETVAAVHCDAPMGTPPDGVYVLTRGDGGAPRLVATLVDPAERRTVTRLAVRDGVVLATLLGYSSATVPSCCPDLSDDVKWRWGNGVFVREAAAGARGV
ncbi:hypothetical protein [Streptomyces sp. SID8352]|uniref:hypothetical protein n=1 Tax=Streptomyces sp. SID8352 TaxID=2690338 RepID=UPI0013710C60|nr:hypothetical protein [Streptomyces sp. SID8352]